MKSIKKKEVSKKGLKQLIKNEKYLLESFDHPFIVKLRYSFQTNNKLFLVMDFMQGGELTSYVYFISNFLGELNIHLKEKKRFDEPTIKFIAAEIILALEYLHSQNIIYRLILNTLDFHHHNS